MACLQNTPPKRVGNRLNSLSFGKRIDANKKQFARWAIGIWQIGPRVWSELPSYRLMVWSVMPLRRDEFTVKRFSTGFQWGRGRAWAFQQSRLANLFGLLVSL